MQDESGKVRHSFELVVLHTPWGYVADTLNAIVWVAFGVELALTARGGCAAGVSRACG